MTHFNIAKSDRTDALTSYLSHRDGMISVSVALFLAGTDEQYGAAQMCRVHINPECDVLHVCITHCLIPALGLVWFVAVHLCGRQQNSRTELHSCGLRSGQRARLNRARLASVTLFLVGCWHPCWWTKEFYRIKGETEALCLCWSFGGSDGMLIHVYAPTVCWHHPLLIVIEDQFTH